MGSQRVQTRVSNFTIHYSLFTIFSSQVLSLLILMSFSAPFDFASGGFLAALPLISTSWIFRLELRKGLGGYLQEMGKRRASVPGSSAGKEIRLQCRRPKVHIPGSGRFPGEGIGYLLQYSLSSLVSQTVKNLPAMWETWVRSQGWEDPLEESMATHSSILAWRIPMDREACQYTVSGVVKSWHSWATKRSTAPQAPSQF